MDGAGTALVPGVQRRKEVDDLGAADLSDDEPIGPHAQRLAYEIAAGHLP